MNFVKFIMKTQKEISYRPLSPFDDFEKITLMVLRATPFRAQSLIDIPEGYPVRFLSK